MAQTACLFVEQGPLVDTTPRMWLNGVPQTPTLYSSTGGSNPPADSTYIRLSDGNGALSGNCELFTWNRALSDAERETMMRNPSVLWKRKRRLRSITLFAATVTIFYPGTDISVAGWTGTPTASPIAANMAETTRDDAGYAQSPPLSGTAQDGIFTLDNTVPVGTWTMTYAARYSGGGQLRMSLLDSSNAVLATGSWQALTAGFAEYTSTFTIASAATRFKIEVKL